MDRNFLKSGALRSTVASRSGHDFEVSVDAPHYKRREHAVCANARGQFVGPFFVKQLARIGGRFD